MRDEKAQKTEKTEKAKDQDASTSTEDDLAGVDPIHTPAKKVAGPAEEADVILESSAVDTLIKYYCRESGVRNLKKHIDKVRLCYMPTCLQSLIRWSAPDLPQGCSEDRTGPWRGRLP